MPSEPNKVEINTTQPSSKSLLCGDNIITVTHISEYSKLVPKTFKTRNDWKGDPIGMVKDIII